MSYWLLHLSTFPWMMYTKFRIFKIKPLFPLPLQQIRVVPSQKWKVLSTIVFVCIAWCMLYKFPRVISDKYYFCSNCQLPMFCLMLKIPDVVSNSRPFVPYSLPKVILFQPMLVGQTEALSQKVWNSHFVMGQSTRLLTHKNNYLSRSLDAPQPVE
jgi:hypothetical protein